MTGKVTLTLEERQTRYDRMKALEAAGVSQTKIGEVFALTRERVRQILEGGRPFGAPGKRRRWTARKEPS